MPQVCRVSISVLLIKLVELILEYEKGNLLKIIPKF